MVKGTRIQAPNLTALIRDHDADPNAATMRGTGWIVLMYGDGSSAKTWGVEYKCDACGEIQVQMDLDSLDLVREVLRANGIVAI